jgi:hypothetical protein
MNDESLTSTEACNSHQLCRGTILDCQPAGNHRPIRCQRLPNRECALKLDKGIRSSLKTAFQVSCQNPGCGSRLARNRLSGHNVWSAAGLLPEPEPTADRRDEVRSPRVPVGLSPLRTLPAQQCQLRTSCLKNGIIGNLPVCTRSTGQVTEDWDETVALR